MVSVGLTAAAAVTVLQILHQLSWRNSVYLESRSLFHPLVLACLCLEVEVILVGIFSAACCSMLIHEYNTGCMMIENRWLSIDLYLDAFGARSGLHGSNSSLNPTKSSSIISSGNSPRQSPTPGSSTATLPHSQTSAASTLATGKKNLYILLWYRLSNFMNQNKKYYQNFNNHCFYT